MKKKVHYIRVSESLVWCSYSDGSATLQLERHASIERANDWLKDNECRNYTGISEASVMRLARVQERLQEQS